MFERVKRLFGRRRVDVASIPAPLEHHVQLCQTHVAAGRFDAAREGVEQGLRSFPDAAPLHFLLANLHLQAGAFDAAEAAFSRALELNPDWPEAHYNRALAARGAGRLSDAAAHVARALHLRPTYIAAALASAQFHQAAGQHEEARADYDRVLAIDANLVEALAGRAAEHLGADRPQEALVDLDRALARDPTRADLWLNRATAQLRLARPAEALAATDRALEVEPRAAVGWFCRARALLDLRRPGEALDAAQRARHEAAADAPLLNDLGLLLRELKQLVEALATFDQALRLVPDFAEALTNRGLILHELDRFDEALAAYDRSLQLRPDLADTHANRGNALQELGRHEEALAAYRRALGIKPGYEAIYLNESLSRLALGDLPGGWPKYEWRWQNNAEPPPARQFSEPLWLGKEPLDGRTVLLYAEQGLGDTIQFCRYAKTLSERGAKVLLRVQPPLVPLLQGLAGVERLLVPGEPPPAFDCHCPLLSLPLALGTSLQSIPGGGAYLHASGPGFAERLAAWQARLGPRDKPRIGLVWSGNAHHKNDRNRSIPLHTFAQIVSPKARFVSLQNEAREADAAVLAQRGDIAWFGAELVDFAETAALVAQLDLVISVDTSVAHLAAAMGKPVWLLLPVNPDWRWLLEREDSPWYETMRLFRQTRRGDWNDIIARIGHEIARLA